MQKKPNILIIWGDDIGWFNISANNNGIMGYRTPSIDRIAKEGANFTDWYGQESLRSKSGGGGVFIFPGDGDSAELEVMMPNTGSSSCHVGG
jgi:hypothetical protein